MSTAALWPLRGIRRLKRSVLIAAAGGAVAASLAAPSPAFADDGAGDGAEAPNAPIVVTGRGLDDTPATPAYDVQEIDRERIIGSASGRMEDVLASVAGFQQFRRSDSRSANPSAQGVTLRALGGNATSRALVLLDGVPMADPMFGYIPFSALSPDRLAAIRVTRGGGSGAFGAGAVAGAVELTSADAATLGLLSGSAMADNRGASELSASLAPQLGDGFAVLSGRWDRGKGFWTTPRGQRVPASARARFDSWSTGLRLVAPLTDTIEIQARGMAFDDSRVLRFDGAVTTSSGQDASLRLIGRGRWGFEALAYVQARDFSNVVISSTSFRKTLDQRRTPSTGLGGKIEVRPPLGADHVLRLGADWRIADGGLQEEAYNAGTGAVTARRRAGGRNTDLGLFAEHDWSLGRLVLTAGGRADRWSVRDGYFREADAAGRVTIDNAFDNRSGWDASLRGGAVWRAADSLALRASGYSGVRLPTLNELYRPFVVFPVTTRANAALRNEELRGVDLGIDVTPSPAVRLTATLFANQVRHAIANVTIAPNVRQRQNVAAIRARGLELGAAAHNGAVHVDASLAWTDAEVDAKGASAALDGMRPAQTPKLAASATLSWRPEQGRWRGWRAAATLRHIGAQFEDDLQSDRLPAATTIDGVLEAPLGRGVALTLRGENLTNTRVVTRNQAGSIDLGAPRTLWAGVKFRIAD